MCTILSNIHNVKVWKSELQYNRLRNWFFAWFAIVFIFCLCLDTHSEGAKGMNHSVLSHTCHCSTQENIVLFPSCLQAWMCNAHCACTLCMYLSRNSRLIVARHQGSQMYRSCEPWLKFGSTAKSSVPNSLKMLRVQGSRARSYFKHWFELESFVKYGFPNLRFLR